MQFLNDRNEHVVRSVSRYVLHDLHQSVQPAWGSIMQSYFKPYHSSRVRADYGIEVSMSGVASQLLAEKLRNVDAMFQALEENNYG